MEPPDPPMAGPGDGGRLCLLVGRRGRGGTPGYGRGPGVPDSLPVYRREADDSRVEQVGALRNRGLATPLIAVE